MSYRAFKRLLGETSLERKCRFLLGAGILILISGSFWIYAKQTEHLVYDQTRNTGRLLFSTIVAKLHVEVESESWNQVSVALMAPPIVANMQAEARKRRDALEEFQKNAEKHWPSSLSEYKYRVIIPDASRPENKPDAEEAAVLKKFLADPNKYEEYRSLSSQKKFVYYGAIRAGESYLRYHPAFDHRRASAKDLKPDDLVAMVAIQLSTELIDDGVHVNRALLISTALVTALLIMAGSYVIIRYVIVKPVKHLKEVSDAISAGHLNVRSEIQTRDEFEDLSHAFNRMLRTLVSMQERYRRLNSDLDKKVDELAQANMALYESNRIKSDFLATMSHELRTPLNSILGFSDVLLTSGNLTEKQQRWVSNIQSSGQQLLNQINDLLDLAKIEAGKMEVHPEEISAPELCEGLLGMFRPMADKKNIDLRGQYDPTLPVLKQDPIKLRQILSNLLSNAVKFTPEGGRVTLRAERDGKWVLFVVVDTGVGIAPEDQELVFEKFRQAANPMTREYEGTGLGLSIVRELAKLLGGEVTLRSELGKGSTFTVRLPYDWHAHHAPSDEVEYVPPTTDSGILPPPPLNEPTLVGDPVLQETSVLS